MRARRLVRSGLVVLLATGWVGLAASCGGGVSGLDGNVDFGNSGGVSVLPGEPADYTGFLANHTGQVVALESARLLPLKSFRTPRLVHVAVETGRQFAASATDWPPSGPGFHLAAFLGHRVAPGRRVNVLYGVVATKLGDYGDGGIRVTVLVGGARASVDVLSVAGTCVVARRDTPCPDSFQKRISNAGG